MDRSSTCVTLALLAALPLGACNPTGDESTDDTDTDVAALVPTPYTNPIIAMYARPSGVAESLPKNVPFEKTEGCPDPTAMHTSSGDDFIYCTSYTFPFSRLNGFPIFKSTSKTLAGPWKPVGSLIADVDDSRKAWPGWIHNENGQRDGNFWGPDVHEVSQGRFVAEYSAPCGSPKFGDHPLCIGTAWSTTPVGPWHHASEPLVTPDDNADTNPGGMSYDPNLLVVSASETYLYWVVVGRGAFVRRVHVGTHGELSWFDASKKPVLIASKKNGQDGEGPFVVAGPNGGFYEFYSTGSLFHDYHVGVRRGDVPDAPFDVEGPAFVVTRDAAFDATGGNSVVKNAKGEDFLVYHAIPVPKDGGCPRENPVWGGNVPKTDENPHCRVQGDRQAMVDKLEWQTIPGAQGAAASFVWPVLANGTGHPSVHGVVAP